MQVPEVTHVTSQRHDQSATETVSQRTCRAPLVAPTWCRTSRLVKAPLHEAFLGPPGPPSNWTGTGGASSPNRTSRLRVIQIRNVPDDVHRALRTRAAAMSISLNELLLDELKAVAVRPPIADVLRRSEGRPGGVETEALVAAVRATRESA